MENMKSNTGFIYRKGKSLRFLFLSFVIALGFISSNVLAANITVDNGADGNIGCTLRAAVTSINTITLDPGCSQTGSQFGTDDQIFFSVPVVNLSNGDIEIDKDINIDGGIAGVTINSDGNSRIFNLDQNSTSIVLNKLTLSGGSADQGGAIYANRVVLTLNESVITGNTASDSGGGIYAESLTTVNMQGSILSNNVATQGGGVYANSSTLKLTNSSITKNTADLINNSGRGGGVWLNTISKLNLQSSHLSDNTAGLEGGGVIAFNNSTIVLDDSVISGNKAQVGGGLSVLSNVDITLNNSIVMDNEAERTTSGGNVDTGGGMWVGTSKVTLNNSTISMNVAGGSGGAMLLSTSELISNNSTIANHRSGFGLSSSIYIEDGSTVTFNNSIVSSSTVRGCITHGNPSVVTADEYNIIQNDECGTSALDTDPELAPLAFNGGETKNHGLYVGSPAIDEGDDVKCMDVDTINNLDQRGEVRPDGDQCDIGSFEGMIERSSGSFYIIPADNGKTVIFSL